MGNSYKKYIGFDPLLQNFFNIQKEAELSDWEMIELLDDSTTETTFYNWKEDRTIPQSYKRKNISDIVHAYNPDKPKEILLYKKRKKFRKNIENQRNELKSLKNKGLSNAREYGSFERERIDNQLRNIGKYFANIFDTLDIKSFESKFISVNEINDLSYYKKRIYEGMEHKIKREVNSRVKIEAFHLTEELQRRVDELEEINDYLAQTLQFKENRIRLLDQDNRGLINEIDKSLHIVTKLSSPCLSEYVPIESNVPTERSVPEKMRTIQKILNSLRLKSI